MKKSDCIKNGKKILEEAGIPNADISARMLMESVLGGEKLSEVSGMKLSRYDKLISMRAKHVPLDKLIGYTEFMNTKIMFSKNVMTPRQETEFLAERIIKDIRNKNHRASDYPVSVLDLCTGSGCLGISIALSVSCNMTMSDISPRAIAVAKNNLKVNNAMLREKKLPPVSANFIVSDLFRRIPYTYDIIVCNPPYIKSTDLKKLEIEVRDFDPILALDGGKDGLKFYKEIINQIDKHLSIGGTLYFEVGYDQAEQVAKYLEKKFDNIQIVKDLAGIDRFVIAKKRI